ncbi:UNVERIFIED_CONTAM: hypothetical protein K2H54_000909 [Gekko kuhli]
MLVLRRHLWAKMVAPVQVIRAPQPPPPHFLQEDLPEGWDDPGCSGQAMSGQATRSYAWEEAGATINFAVRPNERLL